MSNYPSLVDKLYELKSELPNEIFLRQPYGDIWKEFTYEEVINEALQVVTALKAMGLQKGDKIGIYSKNHYQWVITELAIMMGGFITVPFYANLVGDDLNEVIKLSEIKLLFVGKIDNWKKAKEGIPTDLPIINFAQDSNKIKVDSGIHWNDFIKDKEADQSNFRPSLNDTWAIFYTSGTTGVPKGAIMDYAAPANLNIKQDKQHKNFNLDTPGRNTFISYLPLNHIAEQALIIAVGFYNEGQISFVESLYTFAKNLADTKPSVFLAVPNIWLKLQQGIMANNPRLDAMLRIRNAAEEIKKKIRISIGLDNTKLIISGASALPTSTINWFQKIGVNIQETYGMTEAMGIVVLQPRDDIRSVRTGKTFEEGLIKVDPETNEILVKNSWMFSGYYNEPELSIASFDKEGYYKTGDTGEYDSDGYLKVKGRLNDTFKTTKGEFIVPVPIENRFIGNTFIEQICVIGIDLPQPMALIQLSEKSKSVNFDELKKSLLETLNKVNAQLHLHEKLNKLIATSERWSLENNILTPTNKIKRDTIHSTYNHLYEDWYDIKEKFILAK